MTLIERMKTDNSFSFAKKSLLIRQICETCVPSILPYFVKAAYQFYLILYKDYNMETTTAIPVTLTASAKEEIKRLMLEDGFDNTQALRIGVKGGGCSGMTYVLGFDAKTEKDENFEIELSAAVTTLDKANLDTAKTEIKEALIDLSRRPEPDVTGAIYTSEIGFGILKFIINESEFEADKAFLLNFASIIYINTIFR